MVLSEQLPRSAGEEEHDGEKKALGFLGVVVLLALSLTVAACRSGGQESVSAAQSAANQTAGPPAAEPSTGTAGRFALPCREASSLMLRAYTTRRISRSISRTVNSPPELLHPQSPTSLV